MLLDGVHLVSEALTAGVHVREAAVVASDVEAGPVALVHLGHRVPDGFHGNWVGAN